MADKEFSQSATRGGESGKGRHEFLRQVLVFHGIGLLFLGVVVLLWLASSVLLLVFAATLLAVLLNAASGKVEKWLPLSHGWALGLVVLLALLVLGLGGWLLAPRVAEQANQLMEALPQSLQRLQAYLQRYGILQRLSESLPSPETLVSQASSMLTRAGVFFSGLLGAIANVLIILFIGIYLAARPKSYINGAVKLVPLEKRDRAREVFHELGHTLSEWLMGKLLTMLIVGVLTATGLAILGVPLAMVLGIVAGLLDFIPYLGPIMAGVPATLIAFSESPTLALYVILLFVGVQVAEGYLLLPLIERRTVSLPPAMTITMQVLMGAFFGLAGVALATPLVAVVAVLVTMLYVQDVLGDDEAKIPGED